MTFMDTLADALGDLAHYSIYLYTTTTTTTTSSSTTTSIKTSDILEPRKLSMFSYLYTKVKALAMVDPPFFTMRTME